MTTPRGSPLGNNQQNLPHYRLGLCLLHPTHPDPSALPRHPGGGRGAGVRLWHGGGQTVQRQVVPQRQGVLSPHPEWQSPHCCLLPARPGGGCKSELRVSSSLHLNIAGSSLYRDEDCSEESPAELWGKLPLRGVRRSSSLPDCQERELPVSRR